MSIVNIGIGERMGRGIGEKSKIHYIAGIIFSCLAVS